MHGNMDEGYYQRSMATWLPSMYAQRWKSNANGGLSPTGGSFKWQETTMERQDIRKFASVLAAAGLVSACGGGDDTPSTGPAGVIDQLEVVSSVDAYGGATPAGAAGPYT